MALRLFIFILISKKVELILKFWILYSFGIKPSSMIIKLDGVSSIVLLTFGTQAIKLCAAVRTRQLEIKNPVPNTGLLLGLFQSLAKNHPIQLFGDWKRSGEFTYERRSEFWRQTQSFRKGSDLGLIINIIVLIKSIRLI